MKFSKRILSGLYIATRRRHWLAACALFALVAALAQLNQAWQRGPGRGQEALSGGAAVQRLKSDGGYDSLAAAMAAMRYQINAASPQPDQLDSSGAPFYANNLEQQLCAAFAPDGVRLNATPNQSDGKTSGKITGVELRLRLAGFGYGNHLELLGAGKLTASGNCIEVRKSSISNPESQITEWYVNKPEGLEQGFTITAPPKSETRNLKSEIPLRVALAVGDGWRVSVRGDGQGAVFERQTDGLRLGYDQLQAYDARGRALSAQMELAGQSLTLAVDDRQALYPLTIDPIITQQRKLLATDGAANDQFGTAVALSGDTVVVGAPFDDIGTQENQGSAYVFIRSGTTWAPQQKLVANDGRAVDLFGHAVAISGDTIVVGADGALIGVSGAQGAAYVFTRSGTTWTLQKKLSADDGAANDQFGRAVAISGDTVVVGAFADDLGTFADFRIDQGSAYVFSRSGANWTQQQKLIADDGAANDQFGLSVGVSGDTAVVGAFGKDGANANNGGGAYVFVRNGTTWTQQQQLTASDLANGDSFGIAVAISGDTVVVGASGDTIGTNGFQGSAYVFARSGTVWTKQQKLTAADGSPVDFFGASVAISGDTVVVGASADDLGTVDQGSAYVFARSGVTWTQKQRLISEDGAAGDNFGVSVAVSGNTVLVGASGNDIGANTDQGAAYVFVVCENNLVQQPQLIANDGLAKNFFGSAVAVSGETVIVGALSGGFGPNPNQGAAYVFIRGAAGWGLQQKLTAIDGLANDSFGYAVSISGDTVVVGAPGAKIGANIRQGAAYVFVRSGTTWNLQQKLVATDGKFNDELGNSIAISGDTVVVGAGFAKVGANVNQGLACIFTRSGTAWTQQPTLIASDGLANHQFGRSVAVSADTVVIGAFGGGAAYVYARNGTLWQRQAKLGASDAAPTFAISVAISGDTVVVGDEGATIGQNVQQGEVFVFTRSGTAWSRQQKLFDNNGAANSLFGLSVGISGDTVVAGVPFDKVGANGAQGSACVFTRSGTVWTQQLKLSANDGETFDQFGTTVAVSGDAVVAGAPFDDIDGRTDQGSAYVFNCSACPTIALTPASLLNGVIGTAYNQPLTASGSMETFQFSLSDGALPPGLTLAQSGLLSGTPVTAGTYNFTVTATSLGSLCNGSRGYTLTVTPVCPTIMINPSNATLPAGQAGQQYNQTFTQTGGAGTATFTVTAGALPNGLSLSGAGALTGSPSAFGDFNFTVKATDANGCSGSRAYSLHINAPCASITVNPATLPNGTVGTAYNQTATATGGTAPYSFSVSAGSLPGGLALASGGGLTGTPNTAGVFSFTVKATDANGCQGTRAYSVTITGQAVAGLQYYPLPRPVRIMDTRSGQGNCDNVSAPINGGSSLAVPGRLTCEGITIPMNAQAVTGNVTVLNKTNQNGYLTLYPDGQQAPLAANMIYAPNDILANNFTVGLGANGSFDVFAERTLDAVVDISGYYAPPAAGALYYHPLPKPVRLLDTRPGQGNCDNVNAPIAAGTSITKLARGTCDGVTIPQAAQAIVGNATVINGSGQLGYLTIYPNGVQVPLAANLIYFPNQVLANAFTVSLSASGEFNVFGEKTIDLVVDVAGYYSNEQVDANGTGLLFNPLAAPVRLLDTRANAGNCDSVNAPIAGGTSMRSWRG